MKWVIFWEYRSFQKWFKKKLKIKQLNNYGGKWESHQVYLLKTELGWDIFIGEFYKLEEIKIFTIKKKVQRKEREKGSKFILRNHRFKKNLIKLAQNLNYNHDS